MDVAFLFERHAPLVAVLLLVIMLHRRRTTVPAVPAARAGRHVGARPRGDG